MKEARIQTQFGDIRISYQTDEELNKALGDLDDQIERIQKVTSKIIPPPPRTAKPGYEAAYRFASNGDLELLHIPKFRNETAALVLYAYHPELVSAFDIERFTGIKKVASKVLTLTQNQSYFRKVADKYGLTDDGLKLVSQKIGTVLSRPSELDQPKNDVTMKE